MHGSMLAVLSRLLAVSAASALAWLIYLLTIICRRGAMLARQFRGPPVRHMMTGADAIPLLPTSRSRTPSHSQVCMTLPWPSKSMASH